MHDAGFKGEFRHAKLVATWEFLACDSLIPFIQFDPRIPGGDDHSARTLQLDYKRLPVNWPIRRRRINSRKQLAVAFFVNHRFGSDLGTDFLVSSATFIGSWLDPVAKYFR
jgi:hypothetical protein